MNIDWNWFFSSFSQSAAALLGIIGAFIISRLIGIDEKTNILSSDFEDLKISYNKIKNSISVRRYSWVNGVFLKYDDALIKQIQNREFEGLSENEILKKLYEQDRRLYKDDQSIINAFKKLYEKHKPEEEPVRKPGEIFVVKNPMQILNLPPNGIWDKVSTERDLINNHLIDAGELIGKFNKHLNNLTNFTSSLDTIRIIVWILIISFPFTVIYPLHFLPLEIGKAPTLTYSFILIIKSILTLKGILLIIFLFAVEGIFIYFIFLIRQIKSRLTNITGEHTEEYRDVNSYCDYYRK